ncbi:MAG: peptidase M23 [Bacteroidota bacterium]
MKKTIFTLGVTMLIAGIMIMGCQSSTKKLENAQNEVADAYDKLDAANDEYLADVEKYRIETAERIAVNDKSISEFKTRIQYEKIVAKEDYEKKIAALEQKNSDIKKKMDEYKADGKENWLIFKKQFNNDMDELIEALKNLTMVKV